MVFNKLVDFVLKYVYFVPYKKVKFSLRLGILKHVSFFPGSRAIKEAALSEEIAYHGRKIISEEVLPGLGTERICDRIKGFHLGYMVNRLIFAYLGRIHCDDRDHLQNKRFDLAGPMLATLFKK